jgi:hypothetical protein
VWCYCLQPDINEKMRAILIDWLVEVHLKFKVSTCLRSWPEAMLCLFHSDCRAWVCCAVQDSTTAVPSNNLR